MLLAIILALQMLLGSSCIASPDASSTVPDAYIVEFESSSSSISTFYSNLTANAISVTSQLNLSHSLFNGASFRLDSHDELDTSVAKISSMGVVKNIWPLRQYGLPASNVSTSSLASTPSHSRRRKRETADLFPPHVMGRVDKLHAEGYTGKGLFVAIVDTGVDYTHPALGGGFGPGFKFAYGYDLVGDNYTGSNTPVPDDDPYSSCQGHGTHVSGILGANPNPYNFTGVVPDATLGMYRVFGCGSSVGSDVLIAAFMMAHEAGADIITASLGGFEGWTEDPVSVAVSRIVDAGTPCSVACGNDGEFGAFFTSAPSDGKGVIAVGSIDSITTPNFNNSIGYYTTTGSSNSTSNETLSKEFAYAVGFIDTPPGTFVNGTFPLWAIVYNTTSIFDGCSPFPEDTPDLSSKMVFIQGGECTFLTKATNAAAFGAKNLMFIATYEGEELIGAPGAPVDGIAHISLDLGAVWIDLLAAGNNLQVTLTGETGYFIETNVANGGYMSTFSSWGPNYELYIKPVVSAPGGNILSTWPDNQYAVDSGTSMATPYIAGVVALMKQVRGPLDPNTVSSILGSTAKPVHFNQGTLAQFDFLAPVAQQGGGMVDAYAAAHTTTLLSTPNIALNDTAHSFIPEFGLLNTGPEEVTYTFSNLGAATVYTLAANSENPEAFPNDMTTNYADLEFIPPSLTLVPGSSSNITVKVTIPYQIDQSRIPVYGGYISINGSNGEQLTLPYAGVATDMKSVAILDTENGYPYLSNNSVYPGTPIAANTVFTLTKTENTTDTLDVLPSLYGLLSMGSMVVRADIIPALESSNETNIVGELTLGSIPNFPQYYNYRGLAWVYNFDGRLSSGEYVPAGNYTILVRALKIFGDPAVDSDYEQVSTVPFIVQYSNTSIS